MNLKAIEREIEYAEDTIRRARDKKANILSGKMFRCVACKGNHKIKTCTAVQTHYYVAPYGCSGGDYWNDNDIWILCPKTKIGNRALFLNKYDVPYEKRTEYKWNIEAQFKRIYTPLFKDVIEVWRENPYKYINNDYFEKNSKKFGLSIPKDR
jgi:putative transposon-encoded protein